MTAQKSPANGEPMHTEGFDAEEVHRQIRVKLANTKALCDDAIPLCHQIRVSLLKAETCFESQHVGSGKYFLTELLKSAQTALKALEGVK